MESISYRRTHLYLPHNNSSVQMTAIEVWHSQQIIDGMWISWTTPRDSILLSPASTLLELPCQGQRGSNSTASARVSDVPALACTNGYGHFCGLCVWRRRKNVDHVVLQCAIHRPPHLVHGLTVLDDETIEWLLNACHSILVRPSSG